MRPTRIFLDLDDVLNCCTMDVLRHVGCPVGSFDFHAFDPKWGFDIIAAANALHPTMQFTVEEFWKLVGRDFWANAPKSEECDWLIEACLGYVDRKDICILTSPISDPQCLAGKLEWIHSYMPSWIHRQFLIGPCKYFCARPDALLIDDRDKNVEDFMVAGGLAITMPRPWNRLHEHESPRIYVQGCLDYAFGSGVN